ncbi:unnamed protein product [Amoebophrya sp. A25]|nr:unnamed protein product [Amoebophrya sp. A25]|eukprot:GSA25T00012290001.1
MAPPPASSGAPASRVVSHIGTRNVGFGVNHGAPPPVVHGGLPVSSVRVITPAPGTSHAQHERDVPTSTRARHEVVELPDEPRRVGSLPVASGVGEVEDDLETSVEDADVAQGRGHIDEVEEEDEQLELLHEIEEREGRVRVEEDRIVVDRASAINQHAHIRDHEDEAELHRQQRQLAYVAEQHQSRHHQTHALAHHQQQLQPTFNANTTRSAVVHPPPTSRAAFHHQEQQFAAPPPHALYYNDHHLLRCWRHLQIARLAECDRVDEFSPYLVDEVTEQMGANREEVECARWWDALYELPPPMEEVEDEENDDHIEVENHGHQATGHHHQARRRRSGHQATGHQRTSGQHHQASQPRTHQSQAQGTPQTQHRLMQPPRQQLVQRLFSFLRFPERHGSGDFDDLDIIGFDADEDHHDLF